MYFWRIRELVQLLGERELTEREAFRYYFVQSVLVAIMLQAPKDGWNVWDKVSSGASVLATIVGLIYCYRSNGGDAGKAFLPRVLSVLWVVSIRVVAGTFLIAMIVTGTLSMLGRLTDETSWWEALMFLLLEVVIYVRVAAHLKRIRVLREHWQQLRPSSTQLVEQLKPSGAQ